ncbi:MAG: hypothetical protein HC837_16570 [Chloroflexaceae bacterium]|nr:hypothetical protein [Chloroflexaceae bacterium]
MQASGLDRLLIIVQYTSLGIAALEGAAALVAWSLPLAGLVLSPSLPLALRPLLLWAGVPFIVMSFVLEVPNTHYYAMNAAAALLIAVALGQLVGWLAARRLGVLLTPVLSAAGIALLAVSLPYLYLLYVQQWPEYQRSFPAARPDLYRTSTGDSLPDGGYFGFPHRDGWKVIGELYQQAQLQGSYSSNQKERMTGWYTRGALRCDEQPDYLLLARGQSYLVPTDYYLLGYVLVDGRRMLDLYRRGAVVGPLQAWSLDDTEHLFDNTDVPHFPLQRPLDAIAPQYPLDAHWSGGVRLRGYDLDRAVLQPGQMATLLLSWQLREPVDPLQQDDLVVQLLNASGVAVGQVQAVCDAPAPGSWTATGINETPFQMTLPDDLPPGAYTLQVGLRHRSSGAWRPLASGAATLPLTTLTVAPAPPLP